MFTGHLERISFFFFFSTSCGSREAQNQMLVKAKPVPQALLRVALWGALPTQVVPSGRGTTLDSPTIWSWLSALPPATP